MRRFMMGLALKQNAEMVGMLLRPVGVGIAA
jgi:hypothetical protein